MSRTRVVVVAGLAALGTGGYGAVHAFDHGYRRAGGPDPAYWAVLAVGAVVAVAGWMALRGAPRRVTVLAVLLGAIAFRAVLVPTTPTLSDDAYRYLWDGRVQAAGHNPYAHPPRDATLADLRDDAIYPNLNRRYAPTIYPAGAQLTVAGTWQVGIRSTTAWKALLLVVEVASIALILVVLRRRDRPLHLAVAYAWNPLPVLAFGHAGHLDALVVLGATAAAAAWTVRRTRAVGLLLGAAAAWKLYPLLFVPGFLRDRDGRWRWPVVALVLAVPALAYLPYLSVGSDVLGFLTSGYLEEEGYASGTRFHLAGLLHVDGRLLAGLVGLVVLAGVVRSSRSAATRAAWILGPALLLTTPYPWYATGLVALATVGGPAGRERLGLTPVLWPAFGAALYVPYVAAVTDRGPPVVTLRTWLLWSVLSAAVLGSAWALRRASRPPEPLAPDGAPLGSHDGICVVLPALDEADALPAALRGRPADLRVLVVDNGSTDATAAVAEGLGATVIREPRRGFGAACWAGVRACDDADIVVFMDADATFDWRDVDAVVAAVAAGDADLVLGARLPPLREPGSMTWHVAAANRVLGWLTGVFAGVPLRDLGPLRAIRRDALLDLSLRDRTYGWPLEMVLRAGRQGLRVREVPVRYRVRAGTSKVTGRPVATVRAVVRMLVVLLRTSVRPRSTRALRST